jgi:hypothetical protein
MDSGTSVQIERYLNNARQWVTPHRDQKVRVKGIDVLGSLRVTHTGIIPNLGMVYVVPGSDVDFSLYQK